MPGFGLLIVVASLVVPRLKSTGSAVTDSLQPHRLCRLPGSSVHGVLSIGLRTVASRLYLVLSTWVWRNGRGPHLDKNKGVIVVFRSFLHARNPDMISGGGLGPPSPLSPARTYLWAQLGSRKGEKRPPRPLFLPQKPLLGAAGDVATDSGASISLLPRGCGCPPASGGDQKSGGQREFGGSLWHVQPSLCPGPRARPSLHDPPGSWSPSSALHMAQRERSAVLSSPRVSMDLLLLQV